MCWAGLKPEAQPSLYHGLCVGLLQASIFLKPKAWDQAWAFNLFIELLLTYVSDHVLPNTMTVQFNPPQFQNQCHPKGLPATWLIDHSLD